MGLLKYLVAICGLVGVFALATPADAAPKPATHLQRRDGLQVKFKEDIEASLIGDQFVDKSGQNLTSVNQLLQKYQVKTKRRLLQAPAEEIKQRRAHAKAAKLAQLDELSTADTPDLNSYYRIQTKHEYDLAGLVSELRLQNVVETVFADPLPPPPPVTANYSPLQTYFKPAATGMNLSGFSTTPGALGNKVTIADIEYSWNTAHEDLSLSSTYLIRDKVGTPADPYNDNNHGTAVAGSLMAKRNGWGIDGMVSGSKLRLVNTYSSEFGWDPASAIYLASSKLTKGDVMVIEQQAWDENSTLLPLEWIPSVYDAIKLATQSGIIVVEAAGNSGVNLDNYGTTFPSGKTDSGAIMVGAGAACGTQAARTRLYFSNYGKRLNVQGQGECVATTGYGDLFGPSVNTRYTKTFSGTSSATALVAGATAALSSAYETKTLKTLTPARARSALATNGTAQNTTIPGKIGPQPNVPKAYSAAIVAWP